MNIVTVLSAGMTHRGKVRSENQDQFLIAELGRTLNVVASGLEIGESSVLTGGPLATVFLVADGMGGHLGGKEASNLAIQYYVAFLLNKLDWLVRVGPDNEASFLEVMRSMLFAAHRELEAFAQGNKGFKNMGTTMTFAYVVWPSLYVLHAGDTRCYLWRQGELRRITRDHTVAHQMMLNGQLSQEDHERSPWANVLMNALGAGAEEVFADIYKMQLQDDDRILLCSDGLNKHVSDSEINETMSRRIAAKSTVDHLVQSSLDGGGTDNVSVVVADFRVQDGLRKIPVQCFDSPRKYLLREFDPPQAAIETTDADQAPFQKTEIREEGRKTV